MTWFGSVRVFGQTRSRICFTLCCEVVRSIRCSVCPSFASGHHHDLDGLHVFLKKSPTGFNDTLVRIRGGPSFCIQFAVIICVQFFLEEQVQ